MVGVDGIDMWPYITGAVAQSPRTSMMISSEDNGALISGDYKLIIGVQSYGFWQAPNYPNATTNHSSELPFDCGAYQGKQTNQSLCQRSLFPAGYSSLCCTAGDGCLFNIQEDPSEYNDLAASMPAKLQELKQQFATWNATKIVQGRYPTFQDKCEAFVDTHQGFLGPYVGASEPPVVPQPMAVALA